jgi:acetyl esterase/lipase
MLVVDAVRLPQRAQAAGVEVILEDGEGMPHVWHRFGSFLRRSKPASALGRSCGST